MKRESRGVREMNKGVGRRGLPRTVPPLGHLWAQAQWPTAGMGRWPAASLPPKSLHWAPGQATWRGVLGTQLRQEPPSRWDILTVYETVGEKFRDVARLRAGSWKAAQEHLVVVVVCVFFF